MADILALSCKGSDKKRQPNASFMKFLVVAALLVASAAYAQPLRVAIECENEDEDDARTKACPAFLLGFVDEHRVMLLSPRSNAEVVVYANTTEVALVDRVHLRFVGRVSGAPSVIELDADLDTRTDDDLQRAALEPVFLRGMALFVAARFPHLVTVGLADPEGDEATVSDTSPWDFAFELGGLGNRTERYQTYNASASLKVGLVQTRQRGEATLYATGGANRQPPLVLDDGTEVSVDTTNWLLGASLDGAWLYNHCYSIGGVTNFWRDDPKGQHRYAWNAEVGGEWDRFRADDPRGNRLAVFYLVGYQVERYNLPDVLGERFARYPIHTLGAAGKLRKDKVTLGIELSVGGELIHPERRHHITASPSLDWQLGGHVDVELSFSITKRELPGPDETLIDPTDFAQLSRLAYAEPLAMNATFNLRIHSDRTNGERNDRLTDVEP